MFRMDKAEDSLSLSQTRRKIPQIRIKKFFPYTLKKEVLDFQVKSSSTDHLVDVKLQRKNSRIGFNINVDALGKILNKMSMDKKGKI